MPAIRADNDLKQKKMQYQIHGEMDNRQYDNRYSNL